MPFLIPVFEFLGSILGSRIGMAAAAFAVGWGVSAMKCDFKLDEQIQRIKTEHRAALEVEIARERASAAEIAQAAVERAAGDQQTINELNDKINNFSRQEAPRDPKTGQCLVDSMFVDVVRDLAKPGKRSDRRGAHRR